MLRVNQNALIKMKYYGHHFFSCAPRNLSKKRTTGHFSTKFYLNMVSTLTFTTLYMEGERAFVIHLLRQSALLFFMIWFRNHMRSLWRHKIPSRSIHILWSDLSNSKLGCQLYSSDGSSKVINIEFHSFW